MLLGSDRSYLGTTNHYKKESQYHNNPSPPPFPPAVSAPSRHSTVAASEPHGVGVPQAATRFAVPAVGQLAGFDGVQQTILVGDAVGVMVGVFVGVLVGVGVWVQVGCPPTPHCGVGVTVAQ